MFNLLKMLCLTALLSLMGCKDVLNQPLSTVDRPTDPDSLDGRWMTESKEEQLDIIKTNQEDWYQFKWQQKNKVTEGRFVVSYFKLKRVLNIDLASIKINDKPVVESSQSAFLLAAAFLDDEELTLIPADMEKFEKHFSKYFYASPIMVGSLCVEKHSECTETFTSGNVLMSKRMKKFNDEFVKKYRSVFPGKHKVRYYRS
ncbi:hypothetical protein [Cellvibrio sp. pealriver]|uniref:hypothetical protein n=1 Tax=Cellvibrio sp. pealriver TaxID=1622269 RepID=UPI00066FC033|nr:hypothetical protein [Cellvibrio sp. pealriver]